MAIIEVPITKAKDVLIQDTSELSTERLLEAVTEGLKVIYNAGMSKILLKGLEGEELKAKRAEALEVAKKNQTAHLNGEYRLKGTRGAKAVKVPAEVNREALRLAVLAIDQHIKDGGEKPTLYAKSDKNKWAKELLETDDTYFKMAEEAIAKRKATPIKISLAGLKPSEKLVKADEAKKAKASKAGQLSAKQASIPAVRQKPGQGQRPTAH